MRGGSALVLLGILVLLHSFAVVNDKFSDFVGFIMSYRGLCGLFLISVPF